MNGMRFTKPYRTATMVTSRAFESDWQDLCISASSTGT
jgi:hypothetical protein